MSSKDGLLPYAQSLAGTLLAAREAVMTPIRVVLRDAGVTEQQWRVLRVINDTVAVDATRLAGLALLHMPSLTRIVRELEGRGLISRVGDALDGRRSVFSLTRDGKSLLQDTSKTMRGVLDRFSAGFGQARLDALRSELIELTIAIAQPEDATPDNPTK